MFENEQKSQEHVSKFGAKFTIRGHRDNVYGLFKQIKNQNPIASRSTNNRSKM